MSKLNVAIIFGGCSEEHDISIKSAKEIEENLNRERYNPVFIAITRKGEWRICDKVCTDEEAVKNPCGILIPDPNVKGVIVLEEQSYKKIPIDVIFPIIHGKMGEDGTLQGILQLSKIPFVGCHLETSVIGMDKALTHMIVHQAGVKVPEFEVVQKKNKVDGSKFTYPVFVKPARSGSSFGVNKVESEKELSAALAEAFTYDNKVLIEEAIEGIEVGCAIMGNGNELITGEVDEIIVNNGFFKIHQEANPEKGSNNSTINVPAKLDEKVRDKIKETAKTVYYALGCQGLTRVDMFLEKDGTIVLNEVNTMPGFTCYSRYPRMMKAAGFTISEVIDRLIALAMQDVR